MHGLTQVQSDAVIEVMARYEGFIKDVARTEHQSEGECLHCRAETVLTDCRRVMRGPDES